MTARTGKGWRRRKNGWIEIYFTVDGVRRFERIGSRDPRVARQRLAAIEHGEERPARPTQRASEYLIEWGKALTNVTAPDDRTRIVRHIAPHFTAKRLADVDVADVLRTIEAWDAGALAASTKATLFDLLRRALDDAEQRNLIPRNPCAKLRKAQRPRRDPAWKTAREPYSLDEAGRLLFDPSVPPVRRAYYSACVRLGARRVVEALDLEPRSDAEVIALPLAAGAASSVAHLGGPASSIDRKPSVSRPALASPAGFERGARRHETATGCLKPTSGPVPVGGSVERVPEGNSSAGASVARATDPELAALRRAIVRCDDSLDRELLQRLLDRLER